MRTNPARVKQALTLFLFGGMLCISCNNSSPKQEQSTGNPPGTTVKAINNDSITYKTEKLVITRLTDHVYEHTSFLTTKDFGNVPCNGMIVINEGEAVIFDTPANDSCAAELINYLSNLNYKIKGVIATHFHEDCVGGVDAFTSNNIPCYASTQTIKLLKNKNSPHSKTLQGFDDNLTISIGNKKAYTDYLGEGHTKDNIIGYFPDDKALFGGCLIKEMDASKGNLEDANVIAWPATVSKLKQKYGDVTIVIPGHGEHGGSELLDYTIKLFK